MKVVHLCAFFQPELGYEEYYTASKQVEMGLDVSVITSRRPFPYSSIKKISHERNYQYKESFTTLNGIKIYRLPTAFALYDLIFLVGLRSLLRELQPDIVHGHDARSGFTALGAYHTDLGYTYILDQHEYSIPTNAFLRAEYYLINQHFCKYAFKHAKKVISATQETTNFLTEFYNLNRNKLVQLTLGADTDMFYFEPKARKKIRNNLGIEPEDTAFIFAGKLEKIGMFPKKVELLIDAFAKVTSKYPSKLIIVGSGDEKYIFELKARVKNLKLDRKVHFIEFQPQNKLRGYYSAADVGVWPAQATMTIIEAMACKLAIVIPDRATVNHLVAYDNGFLFPMGDLKTLEKRLRSMASDRSKLNAMRNNSEKAVNKELNYNAITKKVVDVYKDCLGV